MGKVNLWQKVTVIEANLPTSNHTHTGRVEGSTGEGQKHRLPEKEEGKYNVFLLLRNTDLLSSLHPTNTRRKDNQRNYSKGQICEKHCKCPEVDAKMCVVAARFLKRAGRL